MLADCACNKTRNITFGFLKHCSQMTTETDSLVTVRSTIHELLYANILLSEGVYDDL